MTWADKGNNNDNNNKAGSRPPPNVTYLSSGYAEKEVSARARGLPTGADLRERTVSGLGGSNLRSHPRCNA